MNKTYNDLISFVNQEFEKLGMIDYKCTEIIPTRHSASDFGVARMYVKVKNLTLPDDHLLGKIHFYCFYSLKELNRDIKKGSELFLQTENRTISNFELKTK